MVEDFPADVRRFIEQNIESLAQLELLLMIHGEKERLWSVSEVSKSLSIAPRMSDALLLDLTQRGFAEAVDICFRYRADDVADQLIAKLGATYHSRRVAVTTEIYSKPINRLKSFAEAFRLRREQ